jgi:hypothetical protein
MNIQQGAMPMTPVDPSEPENDATNTIPYNHTTAAENLLTWPPIHSPDYVRRGEGHNRIDRSQGPTSIADSPSSFPRRTALEMNSSFSSNA